MQQVYFGQHLRNSNRWKVSDNELNLLEGLCQRKVMGVKEIGAIAKLSSGNTNIFAKSMGDLGQMSKKIPGLSKTKLGLPSQKKMLNVT